MALSLLECLLLVSLWTLVSCECPTVALVGLFYRCEVPLFSNNTLVVVYRVREEGHAGRPDWLGQSPVAGGVVLYGTPSSRHLQEQLKLNVYGVSADYEMEVQTIELSVEPLQGSLALTVDLQITNMDFIELIESEPFTSLQQTLSAVYTEPVIIRVRANNIVPVPPDKTGVVVTLSPGVNVTTPPDSAPIEETNQLQENCDSNSSPSAPPTNYSQLEMSQFTVNWCQYRLMNSSTPQTAPPPPGGTEENLPPMVPPLRGSILTLIIIAVIVAVLMAVVTCMTSYVCCSRRRYAITVSSSKQAKYNIFLADARHKSHSLKASQMMLRNMPEKLNNQERRQPQEQAPPLEGDDDYNDYENMNEEFAGRPPEYHYQESILPENSVL